MNRSIRPDTAADRIIRRFTSLRIDNSACVDTPAQTAWINLVMYRMTAEKVTAFYDDCRCNANFVQNINRFYSLLSSTTRCSRCGNIGLCLQRAVILLQLVVGYTVRLQRPSKLPALTR